MQKISAKLIYNLIKKTIGKGHHRLHEPLFYGTEIKYIKDTIKKNFVSSAGIYADKFEKKIFHPSREYSQNYQKYSYRLF